ncbi:MAG: Flp family type IVb pilin [Rhodoferax sp.]|nr:Flp family type IVb pilin [Rhodoferax sp.]MDP1527941.1 Flp family type IVb pilin [Rhodoferax sp.]MDP1944446.1 Flp family type IVb pilin [Rhodoferax sp.]MDP3193167.1 Flp family type IVb pilin [Rhodoferax sp.]MDP3337005.1 Flp family type IVb pilin [Rhodoferax sp.]MDP3866480.1 Flp family type IVb pilin [Rhodoferax sp.]
MKYHRGVTSIEYAMIASLIALAIIVGVGATGEANAKNWSFWTGKVIAVLQGALGH